MLRNVWRHGTEIKPWRSGRAAHSRHKWLDWQVEHFLAIEWPSALPHSVAETSACSSAYLHLLCCDWYMRVVNVCYISSLCTILRAWDLTCCPGLAFLWLGVEIAAFRGQQLIRNQLLDSLVIASSLVHVRDDMYWQPFCGTPSCMGCTTCNAGPSLLRKSRESLLRMLS